VGGPGRDYPWILSGEPSMDEDPYNRIVDLAKHRGYDVSRLLKTSRG
jgi:apolipoprotein D and lipocalin family protein